ncbi:GAF domain-containing sensor histidine kinase [Arabiibacter massiliensis]|uniref:GAF domain-containing sensor histidine kinase n=1 Tax=Arabiibacter massiliensis TaxID=1870985 RepID=UPI00155B0D28|nr:GAF domain-containing sensor histidine kinase [Arabiibacter massiliensis]
MDDGRLEAGRKLARAVLEAFGFDFVGLCFVPDGDSPELVWDCAAGNTSNRYRRIVLPAKVGVLGTVFATGRPILVRDVDEDIERTDLYQYPIVAAEGLRAFLAFPLLDGNRVTMIFICAVRDGRALDAEILRDAQRFAAGRAGLDFIEREPFMPRKAGREPVYTEVTHKILQAQEDERKRVARELHDGLSQEILLAQIELRKLKYLPAERKDEGIEQACEKLREIMTHVSEIATGLRPAALDELGLAAAIAAHCAVLQHSFGVEIAVDAAPLTGADEDCECALYRIFQEAITNACKYSRAEGIAVRLGQTGDDVELRVEDRGIGFDAASPKLRGGGLGLEGMRERAELVGGTVSIESAPDAGTTVTARIPLARALRKGAEA